MPPTPLPLGAPVSKSAQVNARIRALMLRARGRRLTAPEREAYEDLLGRWVTADRDEGGERDRWAPVA